jgi:hypothetical protein
MAGTTQELVPLLMEERTIKALSKPKRLINNTTGVGVMFVSNPILRTAVVLMP